MTVFHKFLPSIAVAVLTLAGAHSASAREFADIYTECGLGAMIAPNNGAVAAITNVIWDSGTTAITSNVSSADTCAGGKKKTAAFITQSYAQIEQDLARGEGAHVSALMAMASCPASAQAAMSAGLRQDLAERVSAAGYAQASRFEHAQAMYEGFTQRAQAAACTL